MFMMSIQDSRFLSSEISVSTKKVMNYDYEIEDKTSQSESQVEVLSISNLTFYKPFTVS